MFSRYLLKLKNNNSFTLIELLIVIAILALLMSIIIITLNPSEILKQTRDTKRISNLKSIDNALGIFQATRPTASTGTSNTVYISIPDSSATCANLGLPSLPAGYTYACSTSANYRKTNGTGWIPVNFDSLDIGSPISSLPIDPTNTTSTNLFFTYITGGSWELNAVMESDKSKLSGSNDKTSVDGGDSYSTYEIGTDLSLSPYKDTGLLAYWKFDDGVGATALDSSGYNNTGTLTNGPTWKTQSDCKRGGCLYFDGTDDNIDPITDYSLAPGNSYTFSAWVNILDISIPRVIFGNYAPFTIQMYGEAQGSGYQYRYYVLAYDASENFLQPYTGEYPQTNVWRHIVVVWDRDQNKAFMYVDGSYVSFGDIPSGFSATTNLKLGGTHNDWYMKGYMDEMRIYNRALSASEVKELYESTK
jgi:prepilin-type N-terminal cleavage/methylation domain-containing protein